MPKDMTKEEIAAIERFRAEQEAAANETRGIEDKFIDRYHELIEGSATPPIMEALAVIAAFFHDDDPEFHADDYTDNLGNHIRGSDPNNAQFNQKGMMGNLCQQSDWMLQREEKRKYYTLQKAKRARRSHSQSEICTEELVAAELDYGRCKIVNLPIVEDFHKAVKAAYLALYGEEWTRPAKRGDDSVTTETIMERFEHSERRRRL